MARFRPSTIILEALLHAERKINAKFRVQIAACTSVGGNRTRHVRENTVVTSFRPSRGQGQAKEMFIADLRGAGSV
jgi:hypothetical protein